MRQILSMLIFKYSVNGSVVFLTLFLLFFLLGAIYQLRLFIEIVQVWVFPDIETWSLALILLLLVYYCVAGGFRIIVGVSMISLVQHLLILSLVFAMPFFNLTIYCLC